MIAPRIPDNVYDARGRHDNARNPPIARVWRSSMPSCAWFITIRSSQSGDILQAVFDKLRAYFPDTTYILCASCYQDIWHIHAVIATCNEYSRAMAESRTRAALAEALRAHQGSGASLSSISAVYRGIQACASYILDQHNDYRILDYGDPKYMGRYGNVWHREYTGRRSEGLCIYKIRDWCSNGFPPYCVDISPSFYKAAMQGFINYNTAFNGRRGHHTANVQFMQFTGGHPSEPFTACQQILNSCFGISTAASLPYMHDIHEILAPFDTTAPPNYAGQPGMILYVSRNYRNNIAQHATVQAIVNRASPIYYNVEVLCIVKL